MEDARRGSCLCGAVAYRYAGPLIDVGHCHCRSCRKAQGAAFATNGTVARARFEVVRGEHAVSEFESSPGKYRCFCRICGGKLWARFDRWPQILRIRLGSLDDDPGVRPDGHYWLDHKVAWLGIDDGLPRHATEPEGDAP